jgi:ABC-type Fe3+ transport system substrate-binding protein
MLKNLIILLILATIIALPFVFRQTPVAGTWKDGDPVLVIISPHNDAIRFEFERGFTKWHQQKYGKPVKIDWRNVGGTSEISRYLTSQYADAARSWLRAKHPESVELAELMVGEKQPQAEPGKSLWAEFRKIDDANQMTVKADLFFGGGAFDHLQAFDRGFTVAPWTDADPPPAGLFEVDGVSMVPERVAGETWRTQSLFGNAVSTFGIVYNIDRLQQLGISTPPANWVDLADVRYYRQVGLADPTKSGSIAKAFEMIVHQQMHDRIVRDLGISDAQIAANEKAISAFIKERGPAYKRGEVPDDENLRKYQQSLEAGWVDGIRLIQSISANARYFTDSASKVPVDVSVGDAAVGMAIDFYGRFQAQTSRSPEGRDRMMYITPVGGTSVSCDPVSLLRGAGGNGETPEQRAELRQVARRFIEFVCSSDGQRLWTYLPGTPGGPEKYALRRLPLRRDFYPSTRPAIAALASEHAKYAADPLADPTVDPYQLSQKFTYYSRWTGSHFGVQRYIIRAAGMDSGDELRAAWPLVQNNPAAMAKLRELPTVRLTTKDGKAADEPLTWRNAPDIVKRYDTIDVMREWVEAFRRNYREAASMAGKSS